MKGKFYHIINSQEEVLREALNNSYYHNIDIMGPSAARVQSFKTFNEIIEIFNNSIMHYVFIERIDFNGNNYWEVGGSTMDKPKDYYLFIHIGYDIGKEISDKLFKENKLKLI